MIKINLLSEGKRPAAVRRSKSATAPGQDIALWLMLVGAFLGVLVAAGYWWVLNGRLKEKQEAVAQEQAQVDRLAAVIKEVDDFKVKKKNLADKIQVINDLKLNQQGPVRIMDYVSRALPELLWLDRLKMNASSIEIEGRAFNPNAVAAFLDNLDKVPEFKEGVLKDINQQNAIYKFVLTIDYSFAPKKADEGTTPGTPGKPGTTPPAGAAPLPGAPALPSAPPPAVGGGRPGAAGGTSPAAPKASSR